MSGDRIADVQALNAALGQNGAVIIQDTTATTGEFFCIDIIEDAVFSVLTETNGSVVGTLGSITFPAGYRMLGLFTAITLSSGTVRAYYNRPQ